MAGVTFPDPASLAGHDLAELNGLVMDLTAQAQAYVGDLHRMRRAAIRAAVDADDWTGEAAYHRTLRVKAVADRLGISVTQVYQAIKQPTPPLR